MVTLACRLPQPPARHPPARGVAALQHAPASSAPPHPAIRRVAASSALWCCACRAVTVAEACRPRPGGVRKVSVAPLGFSFLLRILLSFSSHCRMYRYCEVLLCTPHKCEIQFIMFPSAPCSSLAPKPSRFFCLQGHGIPWRPWLLV